MYSNRRAALEWREMAYSVCSNKKGCFPMVDWKRPTLFWDFEPRQPAISFEIWVRLSGTPILYVIKWFQFLKSVNKSSIHDFVKQSSNDRKEQTIRTNEQGTTNKGMNTKERTRTNKRSSNDRKEQTIRTNERRNERTNECATQANSHSPSVSNNHQQPTFIMVDSAKKRQKRAKACKRAFWFCKEAKKWSFVDTFFFL